MKMWQG